MPEDPTPPPPDPPSPDRRSVLGGLPADELFARGLQTVKMTQSGAGPWEPPMVEEVARLFPNYTVLQLLGRGGMGAVYQARQIELDRLVAIKLLPLEISVDQDFADRFRREARAMAGLNHPNIITVHDFGATREGHLYFVMEFVEGANLHEIIHGGGLEVVRVLEITAAVCEALDCAHAGGVIHRDIKPANVMVDPRGRVKVADFGLARRIDPGVSPGEHTTTGTVMGTPEYMAPEQMRGRHVDHRADIYSLGVMLYEMLCGDLPRGAFEPPSHRVAVDPRLDAVVLMAMAGAPEKRFQRVGDMKAAVDVIRGALLSGEALPIEGSVHAPSAGGVAAPSAPKVGVMKPIAWAAEKRSRRALYAVLVAVIVLAIAGGLFVFGPKSQPANDAQAGTSAPLATPVSNRTFDLLALADVRKDRVMPGKLGKANLWEKAGGVLRYRSDGNSGKIVAPVAIDARRYEISLRFVRLGGASQLNLDLPSAPGKVLPIALLAPGLKVITGAAGPEWPSGLPDRGHVLVRFDGMAEGTAKVVVEFDGKRIADELVEVRRWQKSMDPHPEFPGQTLASLFCMRDSFEINEWKLRVLEGEATALR